MTSKIDLISRLLRPIFTPITSTAYSSSVYDRSPAHCKVLRGRSRLPSNRNCCWHQRFSPRNPFHLRVLSRSFFGNISHPLKLSLVLLAFAPSADRPSRRERRPPPDSQPRIGQSRRGLASSGSLNDNCISSRLLVAITDTASSCDFVVGTGRRRRLGGWVGAQENNFVHWRRLQQHSLRSLVVEGLACLAERKTAKVINYGP